MKLMRSLYVMLILILSCLVVKGQQRQMRSHTANIAKNLQMVPADIKLKVSSSVSFSKKNGKLSIKANGIPNHQVGQFPNRGNPHAIKEQRYSFAFEQNPVANPISQPLHNVSKNNYKGPPNIPFGIAVNGVIFDPGTAEFWKGDLNSGWNYCALGGAVRLGLDENHAHVQPSGTYHYHGMPVGLLDQINLHAEKHSPLVGWAADGYPIYALYGYAEKGSKKIIKHTSSFRLKFGERPNPPDGPGGKYDGAFVQDYVYEKGIGTLDECNGCFTETPEFPDGTYAYFITEKWPVIPCAFRANPEILPRSRRNR